MSKSAELSDSICKKAYGSFEKFESWEFNSKQFETDCTKILETIPIVDDYGFELVLKDRFLHRIPVNNYRKLPVDHPFRKIIARTKPA